MGGPLCLPSLCCKSRGTHCGLPRLPPRQAARSKDESEPHPALFTSLTADLIRLGAPDCSSVKRGGGETPHEGVGCQRGKHPTAHLAIKPVLSPMVMLKIANRWALPGGACRWQGPFCSGNPRGTVWRAGEALPWARCVQIQDSPCLRWVALCISVAPSSHIRFCSEICEGRKHKGHK